MAEGFARHHGKDKVEAYSAGSEPSGTVNPTAVKAMAEKGVDLTKNRSKSLDDLPHTEWDWVVTMGCGDACPHVSAKHREDWRLEDPKHLPYEGYKRIRDEIERRVLALLRESIDFE